MIFINYAVSRFSNLINLDEKGYIISEGIYEDRREVVLREKDSFTMTILTYDLDGNLVDAEVYTPSEGSEVESAKVE